MNLHTSTIGEPSKEFIFNDMENTRLTEVRTTLSNGLLVVQPGRLAQIRGLFEQKPQKWDNETSTTPALLNLPNTSFFSFKNGAETLYIHSSSMKDLRIDFEPKYKIKTTTFTLIDNQIREVDVKITTFASKHRTHLVFQNITFTPRFSGNMTITTGINDNIIGKDYVFYEDVRTEGIAHRGILYDFNTRYKRETVCLGQYAAITKTDAVISDYPKLKKSDEGIYQIFDLIVNEGEEYSLTSASSFHSSADQEILEGDTYSLRDAVLNDLTERQPFASSLQDHKDSWDKLHDEIQVRIAGDDEIQQALTFNHSTILSSVCEGYPYAGIGAKEGPDPVAHPYGNRAFWDGDVYCIDNLPPALLETMLLYRYNQLPDAREKARKYTGTKGAFFPWQASRPGYGEGCPEQILAEGGVLIPVTELHEEIHISADVAYFAIHTYRITGNDELLKNYGAEIIIDAARFYRDRAIYNHGNERFELHNVTGPDEYHHSANNNAYTNGMAKWTALRALELLNTDMISDKTKQTLGINREEVETLEHFASNIYIPFDPETFIFAQFDDWDTLPHVDLRQYPGVTYMDVELKKAAKRDNHGVAKNTEDETNRVRNTDIIKQHDATLLPNLLGAEILEILPQQVMASLRAKPLTDENVLRNIYRANYEKYHPHTCDGSSLSLIKGIEIALDAGVDPDDVYAKYKEAVLIDLSGNTHGTQNGLHTGAAGGSMQATVRGFAGIKRERDMLSIHPRLPSHWEEFTFRSFYKGVHFQVDIDNVEKVITITLLGPKAGASIPVNIQGHHELLDGKKVHIDILLKKQLHTGST